MGNYYAIVTCRNSESNIESVVSSLLSQSIKPMYVIIVDDGSNDNTSVILKSLQAVNQNLYVITNPDMGYDIGRVVKNWNKAIKLTAKMNLTPTDYHMISADDTQFEPQYAEKIMEPMDANALIGIASGSYDQNDYEMPHGAGRFVRSSFFSHFQGYYPEKMGYESAVLYNALLHGYNYCIIPEARFIHTRKLGSNHHFYEFGASMRTLGYHPFYAIGRFLKYFYSGRPIGRVGALRMFYSYISYRPKYEGYNSMHSPEIRKAIRTLQEAKIRRYAGLKGVRLPVMSPTSHE
jgi:glycosyltransferase involved in cell wall biosynthesis